MGKPVTQFLVGSVLIAGGLLTGQGWIAAAGLSMVIGSAASQLVKRPDLSVRARNLGDNISDPMASLPVVYGSMKLGINRVFTETTDDKLYLWIVGAICHGPIEGIDAIYLDGNQVIDADGRPSASVTIAGKAYTFISYAHVWKAYGTDGQFTVVEKARGAKTITNTAHVSTELQNITTSTAHGFVAGDIVELASVTNATANRGFAVVASVSSTVFTVREPQGVSPFSPWGNSGTVDHYTPDMATMFGGNWSSKHRGRGVAYVVLRLRFDADRFPNGVPKVEVDVRGTAMRDPRSVPSVAITSSAVGAAVTGVASTAVVTCAAAHGLSEGDIVHIRDHTKPELNGRQRVDRIDSSTVFRTHTTLSGAGTGGTVEALAMSTNPAICVRDYLTSHVYGLGAGVGEIDDTALGLEANYLDEMVDIPIENASSFSNMRMLTQAVGDGANVVFTTETPHDYAATDIVRVTGFADADGEDGIHTITAVTATTFTVALAVSGTKLPETYTKTRPDGTQITGSRAWSTILIEQKRFECHGVADTTASVKRNLEEMLASHRAMLIYQGGKFRTFTRRPTTANSLVLSEANIVGDWEFGLPGAGDVANSVRATFYNARKGYAIDAVEHPSPDARNGFLEDDNYLPIRRDAELRFVTNRSTAVQTAMVLRRESRNPISCAVTCTEAALALAVGDVVQVTHSTPGWVLKKFWVGPITITPDGLVRPTLFEYDETAYDLDAQDDDPFALDTNLNQPVASDAIVVPTVTPSIVYTTSDRGEEAAIRLAFTEPSEWNYSHMIYQVRAREPGASSFTSGAVTMPGSVSGPDLIPVSFSTEYQVTPIAVSIDGTLNTGSALSVIEIAARTDPTPTFATPVATSSYIEYGVTAYDDETKRIEVWSQLYTSDPGNSDIYKASTATRYNDFNKGDGILALQLPVDATNIWRKVTFAPYDKDGNMGPLTTLKTQRATPTPPGAPGSWAVQSNPDPHTGSIIRRVTLNGSAVAGWKVRTYRNGSAYGTARTLVAGDITATYVDVTDSSVSPATLYNYKDSHLDSVGVEGATNTEASLTTGAASSLTTPSSLTATHGQFRTDDDLDWVVSPANPSGTIYHIERSTISGTSGFQEIATIQDALAYSAAVETDVDTWYRVRASKTGYSTTPYSNVAFVPATS